ncbi:unnamed protein product [Malus baccata var. baccata]
MAFRTFLLIIQLSKGENANLKAFTIFPSGIRHMPEQIRDKGTNQHQIGHACQMTCFPKQKRGKEKYLLAVGNHKKK